MIRTFLLVASLAFSQQIGFVDSKTCTSIQGWAADRAQLLTPVTVFLFTNSQLVVSALANGNRPDVAAFLKNGDNGLHGFSLVLPSSLQDGKPHSYILRIGSTGLILSGGSFDLTCTSPNLNPPPVLSGVNVEPGTGIMFSINPLTGMVKINVDGTVVSFHNSTKYPCRPGDTAFEPQGFSVCLPQSIGDTQGVWMTLKRQ